MRSSFSGYDVLFVPASCCWWLIDSFNVLDVWECTIHGATPNQIAVLLVPPRSSNCFQFYVGKNIFRLFRALHTHVLKKEKLMQSQNDNVQSVVFAVLYIHTNILTLKDFLRHKSICRKIDIYFEKNWYLWRIMVIVPRKERRLINDSG